MGAATDARPSAWRRVLPVLLPLALLVGTGLAGLDFGRHWDEDKAFLEPLRRSVQEGRLLPGRYNYPSFGYALSVAALAPEWAASLADERPFAEAFRARAVEATGEQAFRLRLRALFLLVSAAAVVWVHLAVLARGGGALEALLASSLLGLSFEVGYHLRWIAPDGLLMQFGALTLLLVVLGTDRRPRPRAALLAAVAAGLGCGSKYPGGLLVVPAAVAAWVALAPRGRRRAALSVAGAGLAFALAYLATTPGTLLETERFRADIDYERHHYAEAGHTVYTVEPGLQHAGLILRYLATQVLAPHAPLAALFFMAAVAGAVALVRERPARGVAVLAFPLLYLAYMASVRVFLVRNLLVVAPFLAFLAARGTAAAIGRLRRARPGGERWRGAAWALVLLVVLGGGGAHQLAATATLDEPFPDAALRELAAVVRRDARATYVLSAPLLADLERVAGLDGLENLAADLDAQPDYVAFYRREVRNQELDWPFDAGVVRWFGRRDVNLVYYPTWIDEKILVLPTTDALALDVFGLGGGGR